MPAIEPVPWDDVEPELRDAIESARGTRMLSTRVPHQVMAYRPDVARAHIALYSTLFDDALLDERLRELVRLRIALFNDCEACKVARKSDEVTEEDLACLSSDDDRFTPREQAAIRFAELFVVDHFSVDDDLIAELGRHFTKAEIVELSTFSALMLGSGRMVHVLRAYGTDELPPVLDYDGPSSIANVRQTID